MLWLKMFAGPIGNTINSLIATAAGSVIAYSQAKGNPIGDVSNIVAALAFAASTAISGFAATQGVQIPVINADPANGVRVVSAKAAIDKGLAKAPGPLN